MQKRPPEPEAIAAMYEALVASLPRLERLPRRRRFTSRSRSISCPRPSPPTTSARRPRGWRRSATPSLRGKVADGRDDRPVMGVSWDDVADYARWLTARAGGGRWRFELPAEDEWEKAACGPDGRFFPWGDEFAATFCRRQDSRTREPPQLQPEAIGLFPLDESPYGLRDLGGGMREWTATLVGAALCDAKAISMNARRIWRPEVSAPPAAFERCPAQPTWSPRTHGRSPW